MSHETRAMLEVLYRILLSAVRELARVLDKPSPLLSRAERRGSHDPTHPDEQR